jgi:hypothetical protein
VESVSIPCELLIAEQCGNGKESEGAGK